MSVQSNGQDATPGWTFLSNHAHVLICLAADPESRMRDVAARVGITERAVQRIVAELEDGGYVEGTRVGRRKRYRIHADRPLRHPLQGHRTVDHLIQLGVGGKPRRATPAGSVRSPA